MTGEAQVLLILCLTIGSLVGYGRHLRFRRELALIEHGIDPRQPLGQSKSKAVVE